MKSILAALKNYYKCLYKAFFATLGAWKAVLFLFLAVLVAGIASFFLAPLGLLGGLILGLLMVFVIAFHFVLIRSIVDNEPIKKDYIVEEASGLFYVYLSIFFSLFLCNLILDQIHSQFLVMAFGVLVTVIGNPIPEIAYREGGGVAEVVSGSIEFMQENFLEWILPFIVLVSCLFSLSTQGILEGFIVNPLNRLHALLLGVGRSAVNPFSIVVLLPILFVDIFVFTFRGFLFDSLQRGRRARDFMS